VLETVYLIFNEGYGATAGDDWTRPELCDEAVRLARLLRGLLPDEPEVLGLLALLELQSSRLAARRDADGNPVLLDDQDRGRWDHDRIHRGLAALRAAEALGAGMGPYLIQAQIAACHARALHPADTDWARIAGWYRLLAEVMPSPVVELNRAVAVGRSAGPAAGLAVLDAIAAHPKMASNHLFAAVRADLLAQVGRVAEARAELARAMRLTSNRAEHDLLRARLDDLGTPGSTSAHRSR
jgi:predicted RNA polymerase sigma factor